MKNACKMTIKQVPAKWTDWWTDEPDAAIETTNTTTTTTTTTLMMTWTWTLLPVLCRGKALAREVTAAVRPMWVSLYLCVCVCVPASKRVLVCECLWEHKAKTNNSLYASVSWSWPAGSAICDPSCIFTLACTFDHCQHACFVRHVKWAAASKLRQQEASVRGSLLVTGQAKKPTAIAPRRNSYFRILSTMSSLPNCVQIMNTMKLQVSP